MEIRKLLFRKEAKLVTLLLTAMLIASASAAVYYSMEMQSTATVAGAKVQFEQGDDWNELGSTSYFSSTYVFLNITAYPNATLTYEEPVNISNTDSPAHLVRLRHYSISGNGSAWVSNFTFINFTLIQANGNPIGGDFDYYTETDYWRAPTDMGYQSLSGTTEWAVKIETKAVAGATTDGSVTCTIVIALDVQE